MLHTISAISQDTIILLWPAKQLPGKKRVYLHRQLVALDKPIVLSLRKIYASDLSSCQNIVDLLMLVTPLDSEA